MKRTWLIGILCMTLIGASVPAPVISQSTQETQRQALQRQLEALEAEIRIIEEKKGATRQERESLQKEVNSLLGQIRYLETRIQAIDAEIDLTSIGIQDVQENISETQKRIDERRAGIGRLVLLRDQSDREGLLTNLIRFDDISDFFQRIQDVITVNDRLLALVSELKGYRVALELDRTNLEDQKLTLEDLSQEQTHQQIGLLQAKSAKDKLLNDTKGQESAYQAQIDKLEAEKQELFRQLQEMELKVIHGGLYIVRIQATSVPPAGTVLFRWPYDNKFYLTQGYGWTSYARTGVYGGSGHNGLDIAAGRGTPLHAIGAGRIVANGLNNRGWGNWVAIQHPNNMVSVYAHMSALAPLTIGTYVVSGQVIGYEGATGKVTGSHLHLSLYKNFFTYINDADNQLYFNYGIQTGDTLNPANYLPPR